MSKCRYSFHLPFFLVLLVISVVMPSDSYADDLTAAQQIAASGMRLQNQRMKAISENIANVNSVGRKPGENPYRRKMVTARNYYDPVLKANLVKVDRIIYDKKPFSMRYEPSHPAANAEGYVKYPNVEAVIESVDAKEAQRSFEANLGSLEISRSNQLKLIDSLAR